MALLLIIGIFAAIFALVAFRGFVLSYLWAWFLVPLGLPEIGIAHAIGIAMMMALVAKNVEKEDEKREPTEALTRSTRWFAVAFAGTLFAWGMGYILHEIMA